MLRNERPVLQAEDLGNPKGSPLSLQRYVAPNVTQDRTEKWCFEYIPVKG